MSLKLTFVTGFDTAIRKKRLAGLLDIKAFLDDFDVAGYRDNLPILEAIGNELASFYATTSTNPYVMDSLTKQFLASLEVLKEKHHKGSFNSLTKCVAQLKPELSKIVSDELSKLESPHTTITVTGTKRSEDSVSSELPAPEGKLIIQRKSL